MKVTDEQHPDPYQVLVEEAAETLEAPVTVACLPTLEHLILVGDHKQLVSIPLHLHGISNRLLTVPPI